MLQLPALGILDLPEILRRVRRDHFGWYLSDQDGAQNFVESKPATYLCHTGYEGRLGPLLARGNRDVAHHRGNPVVTHHARDFLDQIFLDLEILPVGRRLESRGIVPLAPLAGHSNLETRERVPDLVPIHVQTEELHQPAAAEPHLLRRLLAGPLIHDRIEELSRCHFGEEPRGLVQREGDPGWV